MLKVIKARRYNKAAWDDKDLICKYVTKNGNKCAVGLFIPKGHEGFRLDTVVEDLLQEFPDLRGVMPLGLVGMRALQMVHDDDTNRTDAKAAMIEWVKANVE
jgi:hypothetical protein